MNHTTAQLREGHEAWLFIAHHQADHGTLPPNLDELMGLPLEVKEPRTGDTRVVLIGKLTPKDVQDWTENYEIEMTAQYLAETHGGK